MNWCSTSQAFMQIWKIRIGLHEDKWLYHHTIVLPLHHTSLKNIKKTRGCSDRSCVFVVCGGFCDKWHVLKAYRLQTKEKKGRPAAFTRLLNILPLWATAIISSLGTGVLCDNVRTTLGAGCAHESFCSVTLQFAYCFTWLKNYIQPAKVTSGSHCLTHHSWNLPGFGRC